MSGPRWLACIMLLTLPGRVHAQQHFYECNELPGAVGWTLLQILCEAEEWAEDGFLFQHVPLCVEFPGFGGQIDYTRGIGDLSKEDAWFAEWRLETDGVSKEIPYAAPSVVVVHDGNALVYHFTIADDQFRLIANEFSSLHPLEPGTAHVFRVELFGENLGGFYAIFVDGEEIFSGVPVGPLWNPPWIPQVNIGVRSVTAASTVIWHYLRWGPIPQDSGDFNSDGQIDVADLYYFSECLSSSAGSWPGCVWADMDGDGDTDCDDWVLFELAWTDPVDPPPLAQCDCPMDLNASGTTDAADLALVLGAWGPNPGHAADFNDDGLVNAADLAALLGAWGLCSK